MKKQQAVQIYEILTGNSIRRHHHPGGMYLAISPMLRRRILVQLKETPMNIPSLDEREYLYDFMQKLQIRESHFVTYTFKVNQFNMNHFDVWLPGGGPLNSSAISNSNLESLRNLKKTWIHSIPPPLNHQEDEIEIIKEKKVSQPKYEDESMGSTDVVRDNMYRYGIP
jgi:hypothetical protein